MDDVKRKILLLKKNCSLLKYLITLSNILSQSISHFNIIILRRMLIAT